MLAPATAAGRLVICSWTDTQRGRPAAPSSSERVLTIWDVPVLEPGWPEQLERRARLTGPLIALFGFADRASVGLARARGAEACLELPFEIDDVLFLIDRAVKTRPPESWPMPARFEPPHRCRRDLDAVRRNLKHRRPDHRGQITTASLQFPELRRKRTRVHPTMRRG